MRQKLAICCAYLHDPQAHPVRRAAHGTRPAGNPRFQTVAARARRARRRGGDQLTPAGDGRGAVHARVDSGLQECSDSSDRSRSCGRASITMTRSEVWRKSSLPPLRYDDRLPFIPATFQLLLAAKPRPPAADMEAVSSAAAAGAFGGGLRSGHRLARQCGHNGLASRSSFAGDATCVAVDGTGGLRRVALGEGGISFGLKVRLIGRLAERDLLAPMPLLPRDLVAYQLASVTVTTILKAGLFTLLLLPDLRCVPLGFIGRAACDVDAGNAPHGGGYRHVGHESRWPTWLTARWSWRGWWREDSRSAR